jgi:hypothetical protein
MGGNYEACRYDGLRFHDIPTSFINIGSAIQELIRDDAQTYRQHADRISLLSYLKIRKVGKKTFRRLGFDSSD